MAYKTLLACWGSGASGAADASDTPAADGSGSGAAQAPAPVVAAGRIASASGGHLTILGLALEPSMLAYAYGGPGASVIAAQAERAEAEANAHRAAAARWLEAEGLSGDARAVRGQLEMIDERVCEIARFADLAVMPSPYSEADEDLSVRLLEALLFRAGLPVLVCPGASTALPERVGRKIMVAWDGGAEALRAVRGALSFLIEAETVEIVMVDPEPGMEGEDEPGADLALMLTRHGAPVTLVQLPSAGQKVSDLLARRMRETGADLLVMGAYSHSRLREALIGGPTRNILEALPGPVLMAH